MANNGADIYLILLRPTRVPVAGEAVSNLFQGQVLLESLHWNLHNEDEAKRAEASGGHPAKTKNLVERPEGNVLQAKPQPEPNAEPPAEEHRNRNFEITFTKRVDIATTQMLNSMKAGDIFPSGTLTIHKRSATVMDGTSLVFTIQKIRLLDYQLQVVVTDTMTEMVEEWTAEFGALAYVYKNPPSHYTHANAGQAAAKTASQGTTRAFSMKNIGSPI